MHVAHREQCPEKLQPEHCVTCGGGLAVIERGLWHLVLPVLVAPWPRSFGSRSSALRLGFEIGEGRLRVASVSSAPWAAVIGADLTVLTPRRRWLCLQYLGYQSLGPLLEWRLNDRNVAETVSWATPGDRPDTLHCCHPSPRIG